VIVAIPVYLGACRSGATLITSRSLHRSGSLAIAVSRKHQTSDGPLEGLRSSGARPQFKIKAALQGVIRPWTVQRYYQWRTGKYELPG